MRVCVEKADLRARRIGHSYRTAASPSVAHTVDAAATAERSCVLAINSSGEIHLPAQAEGTSTSPATIARDISPRDHPRSTVTSEMLTVRALVGENGPDAVNASDHDDPP